MINKAEFQLQTNKQTKKNIFESNIDFGGGFKMEVSTPTTDVGCNLSEETYGAEQKEWFCKFKTLFGEESDQFIAMLKECGCYDVNNWKKNTKHVLHRWAHKECDDYNWTWKKITREKNKNATKIQFASLNVRRIPSNIESLTSLRKLTIFHSNISYVPPEIEHLSKLEFFHMIQCPVYVLPEAIGKLPQLKVLEISQCRLTNVPDSIYSSPKLQHLLLDNNFLSSFSFDRLSEIGKQEEGLKRLSLAGNPALEFFGMQQTVDLRYLNLSETNTKMFSGANLPKLKSLILSKQPDDLKEPLILADLSKEVKYLDVSGQVLYESSLKSCILEGIQTIVLKGSRISLSSEEKMISSKEFFQSEESRLWIRDKVPDFDFYKETFFVSRLLQDTMSKKLSSKLKKINLQTNSQ